MAIIFSVAARLLKWDKLVYYLALHSVSSVEIQLVDRLLPARSSFKVLAAVRCASLLPDSSFCRYSERYLTLNSQTFQLHGIDGNGSDLFMPTSVKGDWKRWKANRGTDGSLVITSLKSLRWQRGLDAQRRKVICTATYYYSLVEIPAFWSIETLHPTFFLRSGSSGCF